MGVPAELQDLPGWVGAGETLGCLPWDRHPHPVGTQELLHCLARLPAPKVPWGWGSQTNPVSSPQPVRSLWRGLQGDSPKCHLLLANGVFFLGLFFFTAQKSLKVKISASCWRTSKRLCATPVSSLHRVFVLPSHLLICICHFWTSRLTH